MTVEHGFVDTGVVTLMAFEGLGAEVIPQVVLQVMFVLCDKRTLGALQAFVILDVRSGMLPVIFL